MDPATLQVMVVKGQHNIMSYYIALYNIFYTVVLYDILSYDSTLLQYEKDCLKMAMQHSADTNLPLPDAP